ncbi:CsbD family protein [Longibacter sp.]|uniref:CsbD family protein n=1 Tax=Longibacter sp. TaxID=2045415 RepID=UPI003EBC068F
MTGPHEQQAEGSWKQFKGKLKEAWGVLSDDDLDRYEGKLDQLAGHIQEKTGEARADVRRKLDKMAK